MEDLYNLSTTIPTLEEAELQFAMNSTTADAMPMTTTTTTMADMIPTTTPATSYPSMTPTTQLDAAQEVTNTELLLSSLYLNGIVMLIGLPLYCVLRIQYKRLFAVRQWVEEIKCPLAVSQFGYFAWVWKVYSFTDEELVDQIGLDAVCSLRVLRLGFRLSVVGCFNSVWLFAAYATAPKTETETDLLNHFAINILQQGSRRFLATVLGSYVFFGYFCWQLVRREFPWFIHQRHQWLKQFKAQNYTVFLRNIPKNMRSSQALIQHFELLFGQGSVLQANMVLHINELSSAVNKRKGIVSNLEHALAYKAIYDKRPTHLVAPTTKVEGEDGEGMATYRRCWGFNCKKIHKPPTIQLTVDSIDYYTNQLEKANDDVAKRMSDIDKRAHRLSMMGREDSLHLRKYGSGSDDKDDNPNTSNNVGMFGGLGTSSHHPNNNNNNNLRGGKSALTASLCSMDRSDNSSVFTSPSMGSSRYLNNYLDNDNSIQRRLTDENIPNRVRRLSGSNNDDNDDDNDDLLPPILNTTPQRISNSSHNSSRSSHHNHNHSNSSKRVSFSNSRNNFGDSFASDMNDSSHYSEFYDDGCGNYSDDGKLFEGEADGGRLRKRGKKIAKKVSKGVTKGVIAPSTNIVSKALIAPTSNIVSKVVINPSSKIASSVLPSQVVEQSSKITQKVTNQATTQLINAKSQATSYMRVGATEALQMLDKAENMATTFLRIAEEEGKPDDAAFVTFKSLVATHAAMQMSQHHEPFVLSTQVAPDIPKFIFWGNVGADRDAMQTGQLLSIGGTVAICLFWTVPVTFIVNLTNAQELTILVNKENFTTYLQNNPWFVKLLSNLSPILLLLLNTGLLPIVLKTVSRLEFPPSDAQLEASAFWKMCAFHIIQTFFVSMISGSIVDTLEEMIDNPQEAIYFLARSLPERSAYFMELLMVSTAMGVLLELFRAVPLFQAFVRSLLGWKLTEKERSENIGMFKPLCVVDKFYFSRAQSRFSLYFLVMFTYNSISPLINWFCMVFFLILGSVYRHQFIFNYPPTPDTGGEIWLHMIRVLLSIMIIGEIVLAGFLSLKEAFTPLALMFPLMVLSFLFVIYLQEVHFKIGHYLPARAALRKDLENDEAGVDYTLFTNEYKNPALMQRFLDADWDSGKDEVEKRAADKMKRNSINMSAFMTVNDGKQDPSVYDAVKTDSDHHNKETSISNMEKGKAPPRFKDEESGGESSGPDLSDSDAEFAGDKNNNGVERSIDDIKEVDNEDDDDMDTSNQSSVKAEKIYGGKY